MKAVKKPVTAKICAGWDQDLFMLWNSAKPTKGWSGSAIAVHGRTRSRCMKESRLGYHPSGETGCGYSGYR